MALTFATLMFTDKALEHLNGGTAYKSVSEEGK